ncbi:hypothetical protein AA0228_1187 [Gluconobacter frateurii NRIC 0228]|uniref:Uncharacterized protein n=1 Tax=Gluconobacter frateurii NRIC 0228 TaxID=1307946 RepID=A0ABQ0QAE4_9PROT|nr:hypothetical protein AA0228_1187 [Gluconobacter frateurii NRIC 0228]
MTRLREYVWTDHVGIEIGEPCDRDDVDWWHPSPLTDCRVRALYDLTYLLGATCGPYHFTNIHKAM